MQFEKKFSDYHVTNIEKYGFWLLVDNKEYFILFEEYPVFKKATVDQTLNVIRIANSKFHWQELDADIELKALEHPEKIKLKFYKE